MSMGPTERESLAAIVRDAALEALTEFNSPAHVARAPYAERLREHFRAQRLAAAKTDAHMKRWKPAAK